MAENPERNKIKHWPESERPRERLLKHGAESLSDAHLLAILLRTGSGEGGVLSLALSLLERFHMLRSIDAASLAELRALKGLGTAKIAQLKAAFELGKRLMSESSEGKPSFSSSHALYTYFAPRFKNLKKEYFIGVLLDAKNRLLRECKISEGTLTNSLIHPREAFKEAVKESAASVIFVHNHPSGDPAPSRDDLAVTERLKGAGEIMGIPLLDHVIIGDGRYVSLKERGIL
ncbi:MAG: DNA repair protein RadC [Thermodesulfovibrionales bacterium]